MSDPRSCVWADTEKTVKYVDAETFNSVSAGCMRMLRAVEHDRRGLSDPPVSGLSLIAALGFESAAIDEDEDA